MPSLTNYTCDRPTSPALIARWRGAACLFFRHATSLNPAHHSSSVGGVSAPTVSCIAVISGSGLRVAASSEIEVGSEPGQEERATEAGTPPPALTGSGVWTAVARELTWRSCRPAPRRRSSKIRSSPPFAAQDAHEAPDRVLLPARGFHDFGERGALGSLHHRDDLGLLVAALALVGRLLGRSGLLASLGFLGGFRACGGLLRLRSRVRSVVRCPPAAESRSRSAPLPSCGPRTS